MLNMLIAYGVWLQLADHLALRKMLRWCYIQKVLHPDGMGSNAGYISRMCSDMASMEFNVIWLYALNCSFIFRYIYYRLIDLAQYSSGTSQTVNTVDVSSYCPTHLQL